MFGSKIKKPQLDRSEVVDSKDWQDLLKQHLPDETALKKHAQLLELGSLEKMQFKANNYSIDDIDKLFDAAKLKKIATKGFTADNGVKYYDVWFVREDALTQREALKEVYKLKGKYEPEQHNINLGGLSQGELKRQAEELIKEITGNQ